MLPVSLASVPVGTDPKTLPLRQIPASHTPFVRFSAMTKSLILKQSYCFLHCLLKTLLLSSNLPSCLVTIHLPLSVLLFRPSPWKEELNFPWAPSAPLKTEQEAGLNKRRRYSIYQKLSGKGNVI